MNSNNLMNGEMVKNTEIEQPIFKVTKNAKTRKTAKVFGKAITNELVESGANIASDALMGNDINESFQRELVSGRQKSYIARLVSRRQKAIAQNQRLKKYLNIKGEMELKENEKLLKKKVDSILKSLSENMIILLKILGMVEDINKQSKKKRKKKADITYMMGGSS